MFCRLIFFFTAVTIFNFGNVHGQTTENGAVFPNWFFKPVKGSGLVAFGISDINQDTAVALAQAVLRAKAVLSFMNNTVSGTYVSSNMGVLNESYYNSDTEMEMLYAVNFFGTLTDSNHIEISDTFITKKNEVIVRAIMPRVAYDTSANVVFASKISRLIGVEKVRGDYMCTFDKTNLTTLNRQREKQHYEHNLVNNSFRSLYTDNVHHVEKTSLNWNCYYPIEKSVQNIAKCDIPLCAGTDHTLKNGLWPAYYGSFVKTITSAASYFNSTINILSSSEVFQDDGSYSSESYNQSLQSSKNYNINNFIFDGKSVHVNENNNLTFVLSCKSESGSGLKPGLSFPAENVHEKQLKEFEKEGWNVHNGSDLYALVSNLNYVALRGAETNALHSKGITLAHELNTATVIALELAKLQTATQINQSVTSNTSTQIGNSAMVKAEGQSLSSLNLKGFNKQYLLYKTVPYNMVKARVDLFYKP